jgi:hypothetical protein
MNLEAPKIDQVLVAVGDRQPKRLANTVDAPHGKSFLTYHGRPLLEYTLDTHFREGLDRFVFIANTTEQLGRIEKVVTGISDTYTFRDVEYVQDDGEGTTGLPFHAKRELGNKLDPEFVFDFGHNAARNIISGELIKEKTPEIVVFRGFYPKDGSDHPTVYVDPNTNVAFPLDTNYVQDYPPLEIREVSAPFVLDQQWIEQLPKHGFNFAEMVNARARSGGLKVVYESPYVDVPEIDTPEDYKNMFGTSDAPFFTLLQEHEIYLSSNPDGHLPDTISRFQRLRYRSNFNTALAVQSSADDYYNNALSTFVMEYFAANFDPRPFEKVSSQLKFVFDARVKGY